MSTYRPPIVNYKPPQLADLGLWGDIRFDADDSTPTYIGLHVTNGAATSETDWKLLKFTYSGTAVTRVQTAYNSWDNRASAF